MTNNSPTGVSILDFLRGVIDSTNVPLVRKTPVIRGGGGLRFAWALNPWLGLTATSEISYGESPNRTQGNDVAGTVSLAASVDLAPLINAPIGLVIAAEEQFEPKTVEDIEDARVGSLRITYTGRSDFIVALDLAVAKVPLGSGLSITTTSARFSIRYYF